MRRSVLAVTAALLCGSFAAAQPVPPPGGFGAPPVGAPPVGAHGPQRPSANPLMMMQVQFAQANTTHDGHLTLAQAQKAGMQNIVNHFADIAVSPHNYVTIDDIVAWQISARATQMQAFAAHLRANDEAPLTPPGK